jgi:hypothetical protein
MIGVVDQTIRDCVLIKKTTIYIQGGCLLAPDLPPQCIVDDGLGIGVLTFYRFDLMVGERKVF